MECPLLSPSSKQRWGVWSRLLQRLSIPCIFVVFLPLNSTTEFRVLFLAQSRAKKSFVTVAQSRMWSALTLCGLRRSRYSLDTYTIRILSYKIFTASVRFLLVIYWWYVIIANWGFIRGLSSLTLLLRRNNNSKCCCSLSLQWDHWILPRSIITPWFYQCRGISLIHINSYKWELNSVFCMFRLMMTFIEIWSHVYFAVIEKYFS